MSITSKLVDVETLQSLERKAHQNNDESMVTYARSEQYKVLKSALEEEEVRPADKYDIINQLYRIMTKAKDFGNECFADAVKLRIEALK